MSVVAISQVDYTKHQLGINASKFVVLFNEESNILDLTYRYSIKDDQRIRVGSSVNVSTEDGDLSEYDFRLGYDKSFHNSQRWNFYAGVDFNYGHSMNASTERSTTDYGAYLFTGFLFKMGKYFSLSTEPSLAIFYNQKRDPNSFNPEADKNWTEVKLLNIGQIKVSFHF